MSDLRDFLENIRKHSPKIGEVAMRHVRKIFHVLHVYIYIYYNKVNFNLRSYKIT